jgi:hypothetical protein
MCMMKMMKHKQNSRHLDGYADNQLNKQFYNTVHRQIYNYIQGLTRHSLDWELYIGVKLKLICYLKELTVEET